MAYHVHEASCWKQYEGCGEHHPHSYNCGGGELDPACPMYEKYTRTSLGECPHGVLYAQEHGFNWIEFDVMLRRPDDSLKKLITIKTVEGARRFAQGFIAGASLEAGA
jgi:hypothetical protein